MSLYERYLQGQYQEVYQELVALGEGVQHEPAYNEALLVGREMMRRVRYNLELILPRLRDLRYRFGEGLAVERTVEQKELFEQMLPIYRVPGNEVEVQLERLERLIGKIPIALKCWYEQVGGVNLVGMFPLEGTARELSSYGVLLDPLLIMPLEELVEMVVDLVEDECWEEYPMLLLSPDAPHKYEYSGGGGYGIQIPCNTFDGLLDRENVAMGFVEYLRLCFRWGGFPGLGQENRLRQEDVSFLIEGLLPF